MINYNDMSDLTHLSKKDKLKIVRKEIEKIVNLNMLLFNALRQNQHGECVESYLYASFLIDIASNNIRKMFP